MPNSSFNPFYPAAPIAPTGNVTDFDVQAAELARRRRLAELLQQQSLSGLGLNNPNSRGSWVNVLGNLAEAYAGKSMNEDIDKKTQDLEKTRSEALSKLLAPMGTPAVPADVGAPQLGGPEQGDTASAGPAPMAPMIPAKPPTAEEIMQRGQQIGQVGGKFGQDIGKAYVQHGLDAMLPKPTNDFMAVGGDIFNKSTGKFTTGPTTQAKLAETAAMHEANQQKEAAALEEKITHNRATEAELSRYHDLIGQMNADRLASRKDSASVGHDSGLVGDQGQRLISDKQGMLHETAPDGTISPTPYAGPTTPRATQEKDVAAARKLQQSTADLESVAKEVGKPENAAAFSTRAAIGSYVPNVAGIGAAAQGLSEPHRELRAKAASMTADITHSLYGSAFSAGEQQRAKEFLILPTDDHKTVQVKLNGRLALEKEHQRNLPEAATAAIAARGPKRTTVNY